MISRNEVREPMDLAGDVERIAKAVAPDAATRDDLRQEMLLQLLQLPAGQERAWYLRRLADRARDYVARTLVDAPLGRNGRPILERQTVAVGGLNELAKLAEAA